MKRSSSKRYQVFDLAGPVLAALGAEAQDRLQRHAGLAEVGRQVEQVEKAPVPADQAQVLVEHADALGDVLDGRLEQVAVVLDRGGGVVEQPERAAGKGAAPLERQRQHQARRGGADGTRQQALGVAHEVQVGIGRRRQRPGPLGRERLERAPRPLGAEVARGHRLQLADLDRAAPQTRGGVALAPVGVDEGGGLQALDRLRHAHQRDRDVGQQVGEQAPEHAVGQRVEVEPEQMLRPEPADAGRAGLQQRHRQPAGLHERRQKERVGPDQEAKGDACERARPGGVAPDQAAQERRRELGDRSEAQEPDRGQREGVADHAIVEVGEQHEGHDREPADPQDEARHVGEVRKAEPAAAQKDRHDEVVADHVADRDRGDDHHAGGGRQAADEGEQGQ